VAVRLGSTRGDAPGQCVDIGLLLCDPRTIAVLMLLLAIGAA